MRLKISSVYSPMKQKIKKIFSKLTPWEVGEGNFRNEVEHTSEKKFKLTFHGKSIGTLEYGNSNWIFKYTEEYKAEQFVKPIIDFPDIDKIYQFTELSPFFASRIPNLNQPFHQKKLEKYNGSKDDLASLLQIFGQRSINNPFSLKLLQ